jgi:epsilon-lactone hydrolase
MVAGQGFRPERLIVAGDSSAGGLAAATMLKLRDDGTPLPWGGVMISPWVDLACTAESLDTRADVDLTVTKSSLERMAGQSTSTARTPVRRSHPRCTPTYPGSRRF